MKRTSDSRIAASSLEESADMIFMHCCWHESNSSDCLRENNWEEESECVNEYFYEAGREWDIIGQYRTV